MKQLLLAGALLTTSFHLNFAANDTDWSQIKKNIIEALFHRTDQEVLDVIDHCDESYRKKAANKALYYYCHVRAEIDTAIISALVARGANPNQLMTDTRNDKQTVLGIALKSFWDLPQDISTLIALGVDPNLCNENGETPLHICMEFAGSSRTLRDITTLTHHGANPLVKNNKGETPREAIPDHCWDFSPAASQQTAQLLKAEEQKCLKRIRTIRDQGIPQRTQTKREITRRTPSQPTQGLLSYPPLPQWNPGKQESE